MDAVEALLDRGAKVNLQTDVRAFRVHYCSNIVRS